MSPKTSYRLLSLATGAPAVGLNHVPEGVTRLLAAEHGALDIVKGERRARLSGTHMLLLRGEVDYRVEAPLEDASLIRMDFCAVRDEDGVYALSDMAAAYPEYGQFVNAAPDVYAFFDNSALVISALRQIRTYAAFEAEERRKLTALMLNYVMLVIATNPLNDRDRSRQYSKHVKNALHYIHSNYAFTLTVGDIAEYAGVHEGHLHRLFHEETGCSVLEYVTKLRIDKARALLQRTDIKIADIAGMVGIGSQQYFSRLFKRRTGLTPQAFKKTYDITCNYELYRPYYETTEYAGAEGPE